MGLSGFSATFPLEQLWLVFAFLLSVILLVP